MPASASAWLRPVRPSRLSASIAVFALAVLVFLPGLENDFAYDDLAIIVNDARVRDLDLRGILTQGYWEDPTMGLYRPAATLAYAIDWQISGGSAAWFHFVNALWHAAATVLLLQLLFVVGATPLAAAAGAAVFAVHPVHVEAVANTVGRAELMAAAFVLAAALLWCRPARWLRSPTGIAAITGLFLLGLASKEGALVLPGVLVLIDIGRGRLRPGRIGRWLRARVTPLAATVLALVLFFVLRSLLLVSAIPGSLDPSLEVLESPLHRFYTALQSWPQYARLLFWPRVLLNEYSPQVMMPAVAVSAGVLAGAAILTASVVGGLAAFASHRRRAALALLWFPVTIFPVSNLLIPIGVLIAERTLYLPSAALAFGIVAVAPGFARGRVRAARPAVAAVFAVALGLMISRSVVRTADWKSTNAIFSALVRDRPDNFRGRWHFARLAVAADQPRLALKRYSDAMAVWPHRHGLVIEAAVYASNRGFLDYTHQLTGYALEKWPDDLIARRLHAGVLLDRADTANAYRHILAGLQYHPQDSLLNAMRRAAEPGSDDAAARLVP